ncbi:MAG TPA: response regulator [Syntrophobacteraceae bacterium]|nr:response regulator [Syntrophobacteraceae bacterium]
MRILVVDDSPYARRRIVRLLAAAGHEISEADSGASALELFQDEANRPELVTVDLLMPEMDGMELIRRLRAMDFEVPIVAFSADVQQATRAEAFAAGASEFVSKSEDAERLPDVVQELAETRGGVVLTSVQHDMFTEMMNIAMGQAAMALSQLVKRRVLLKVPTVEIMHASAFVSYLEKAADRVGAAVLQKFSGALNGLGSLVFPEHHAATLVRMLLDTDRQLAQLSSSELTVLTEVGNVVINGALGQLGDVMRIRLKIGLPSLVLNRSATETAGMLLSASPNARHAAVLVNCLSIDDVNMIVYLVLMLPKRDLKRLIETLGGSE